MPGRASALALALFLAFASGAVAFASGAVAEEACAGLFAGGLRPILSNPKLGAQAVPLCYGAFALLYSGASRTPLYAGEHLTRESVAAARMVDRIDSFHDEERLPQAARSRLDDYARSGFDRGHMAPAGDMPSGETQGESFSLANIVPQDRELNRGLWAAIEESVRRLATRRGALFVVTGPIFSGDAVAAINGRVLVPTRLFKAVYDPARGEAGAYLAPNRAEGDWQVVSIQDLQKFAGLDPFPGLSQAAKARAMELPEPRAYSRDVAEGEGRGPRPRETASIERQARDWLHRLARRAWRDLMRAMF